MSAPDGSTRIRRWQSEAPRFRDALWIAGVGLALRLGVVLWASSRFPPTADGDFYHRVATRIAQGLGYTWAWPDGAVTFAAHYPVGYPALIGAAYALFGAHPVVAMLVNGLIGCIAVLAAHGLAAPRASRLGAALAASLVALHPALTFYTPALMTEGIVAALLLIAGWLGVLAAQREGAWRWLLALGAVLGLTTLVRPQVLVLGPVLGAMAASLVPSTFWRRARGGLVVSLVALGVCLPWTWRNCVRMDRCVFVSANGGWNLLIGAAPGATGTWRSLDDLGVPPSCRTVFGEAEKDACFGAAALSHIRAEPGRWLGLVPRKLEATFNYSGAPGWYLRASNPSAFSHSAETRLGVVGMVWERLVLLLGLAALAWWPKPRGKLVLALATVLGATLFTHYGWLATLGLPLVALSTHGRRLIQHPAAWVAACVVALTALTHAAVFGGGRYSMVCFGVLAALAGCLFRPAESKPEPEPSGVRVDSSRA